MRTCRNIRSSPEINYSFDLCHASMSFNSNFHVSQFKKKERRQKNGIVHVIQFKISCFCNSKKDEEILCLFISFHRFMFFTSPNLWLFLLEVVTLAPDDVTGQPSDTEGNTMVLKA